MFDAQGYEYMTKSGVLNVNKGLIVMMKEKMIYSLFLLQGITLSKKL